ncbi:MAG: DUF2795 domain-containing protein [Thermomicrobiales bacterium]
MFDKVKSTLTGAASDATAEATSGYAEYVKDISFPISKQDLLDQLHANGTTEAVIEHVSSLARDHFDSPDEVFASLFPR